MAQHLSVAIGALYQSWQHELPGTSMTRSSSFRPFTLRMSHRIHLQYLLKVTQFITSQPHEILRREWYYALMELLCQASFLTLPKDFIHNFFFWQGVFLYILQKHIKKQGPVLLRALKMICFRYSLSKMHFKSHLISHRFLLRKAKVVMKYRFFDQIRTSFDIQGLILFLRKERDEISLHWQIEISMGRTHDAFGLFSGLESHLCFRLTLHPQGSGT